MKTFKHIAYGKTWKVSPVLFAYGTNNRIGLKLIDAKNGSLVCIASINVPSLVLKEGEIVIRNTEENEGVLDSLVKAGIVSPSKKEVNLNYIIVHIVDLLIK